MGCRPLPQGGGNSANGRQVVNSRDWIYVICPGDDMEPTIKKRRRATELGEYGCSRATFEVEDLAVAEAVLEKGGLLLYQQWKLLDLFHDLNSNDRAILLDVVHAMKRGRTIRIT